METKYNKEAKTFYKVICSECKTPREIYRIKGDNTKPFWCLDCRKSVKPMKK